MLSIAHPGRQISKSTLTWDDVDTNFNSEAKVDIAASDYRLSAVDNNTNSDSIVSFA